MRRYPILVLVLLTAVLSLAFSPDRFVKRDTYEIQDLTRADPTLITEGIDGTNMIAFTVVLIPATSPGTTTLSGGGTINLYFRDAATGWYLADPARDSWALTARRGKER